MSDADIRQWLEQAVVAQRSGDAPRAVQLFEAVLARDPANPHALNSLGMFALNAADYARAEDMFRRAAAADPKEPALWMNVAKAQRSRNDDAGELASLQAALAIDQRHFMALLRKAELHERLDQAGLAAQA